MEITGSGPQTSAKRASKCFLTSPKTLKSFLFFTHWWFLRYFLDMGSSGNWRRLSTTVCSRPPSVNHLPVRLFHLHASGYNMRERPPVFITGARVFRYNDVCVLYKAHLSNGIFTLYPRACLPSILSSVFNILWTLVAFVVEYLKH